MTQQDTLNNTPLHGQSHELQRTFAMRFKAQQDAIDALQRQHNELREELQTELEETIQAREADIRNVMRVRDEREELRSERDLLKAQAAKDNEYLLAAQARYDEAARLSHEWRNKAEAAEDKLKAAEGKLKATTGLLRQHEEESSEIILDRPDEPAPHAWLRCTPDLPQKVQALAKDLEGARETIRLLSSAIDAKAGR